MRRSWWQRWWLRFTDWPRWRFEECAAGYHDRFYEADPSKPGIRGDDGTMCSGYYVTHCRYCRYEDKWESWGE